MEPEMNVLRQQRHPAHYRGGTNMGAGRTSPAQDDAQMTRERERAERGSARLLARLIEQHGPNDRDDLFISIGGVVCSTVVVNRW
jgi:hypothetical protein